MVLVWYGLVPIMGALHSRYKWKQFRQRFDEFRLQPLLDYRRYREIGKEGGVFRFTGGFESITDSHTLWIQGENLTIPVSLANTQTWLLPMQEGESIPESFDPGAEAPERIHWDRISTLTEGARVFVGGCLKIQDDRWSFVSTRETPLMVIFYDCPDKALTGRIIRAGRHRNEYWNAVTPVSLFLGAVCQLYIAASFLNRPAFRLTVICALIALFVPVMPWIPPGLLFMALYRRLAWTARILRAYRDIARLPLRHLPPGQESCLLTGGEKYGCVKCDSLPAGTKEGIIPVLIPEHSKEGQSSQWYVFGALRKDSELQGSELPMEPEDPFAVFGVLPGQPQALALRYSIIAYTLEAAAWLSLVFGIGLNIFFIRVIFLLLWGVSF